MEMGKRGACTIIPRKPHTLNSLRGTEMRYSWKKAEVKKTMSMAVVLDWPAWGEVCCWLEEGVLE